MSLLLTNYSDTQFTHNTHIHYSHNTHYTIHMYTITQYTLHSIPHSHRLSVPVKTLC